MSRMRRRGVFTTFPTQSQIKKIACIKTKNTKIALEATKES